MSSDRPFLSIVSAVYRDFYGIFPTIKEIKLQNPEILDDIEIVVVDQEPDGPHGPDTRSQIAGWDQAGLPWGSQYVPYTERIGTSASRQKAIESATGEVVMCIDGHVWFPHGAIAKLMQYFRDRPDCKDIVSGPILTDFIYQPNTPGRPYSVMSSLYADHLRDQMWGTWASAYQCPCGDFNFATWEENGLVRYETLTMKPERHKTCPKCARRFPLLQWQGHERQLVQLGYKDLGVSGTEAFEISGMGLGMFAIRKEHWPNFHPDAWGFGGEELYIHEKVRRNGGRAMCLPTIPWLHRFPRPDGAIYPNSMWYKTRNLVLEWIELGRDLGPLHQHFVIERGFPAHEWDVLVSDPVGRVHGPTDKHVQPVMVAGAPRNNVRLDPVDLYNKFQKTERDLNQHFAALLEFASQVDHITEFSKRQESAVVWLYAAEVRNKMWQVGPPLSGSPKMVCHNLEGAGEVVQVVAALANRDKFVEVELDVLPSTALETIEPTEMLYLDTVMHADRLRGELGKFAPQVSRFIVVRGTGAFGVTAEGGGEGLFAALREFVGAHPEWQVVYHTAQQYGVTVLSKNPEDYPPAPLVPWPPGKGPGTQLKKILVSLGITNAPNCDCNQKAEQMDRWGIAGCRENYSQIVKWMREGSTRWGWASKFSAGMNAVLTGLAFKINPVDPYPGLVKEAIRLAEVEEAAGD